MEPVLIRVNPFAVAGIQTRTSNALESNPARARIGPLWNRFMQEGLTQTIENALPNSPLYGVYGEYENGPEGEYDVMAAVQVAIPPSNAVWIQIPSGWYLRFDAGPVPPVDTVQTVIGLWQQVWAYFKAPNPAYKRNFTLDFERYLPDGRIELHIAVAAH